MIKRNDLNKMATIDLIWERYFLPKFVFPHDTKHAFIALAHMLCLSVEGLVAGLVIIRVLIATICPILVDAINGKSRIEFTLLFFL